MTNDETLKAWAGYTIDERVVLFHRRFPHKVISAVGLWRFYRAHGIKRKQVRVQKSMPAPHLHNFTEQRERVLRELRAAREKQLPIVYLDELAFTKRTMMFRDYSARNKHLKIDQNNLYADYRSVIATASADAGTVLLDIRKVCNNEGLMISFVKELARKMRYRPFALYMDQLTVHKMNSVRAEYARYHITPIFNVSYSPELNPIETVFSFVKQTFKQIRLNKLANDEPFDMDMVIRHSFGVI